MEKYTSSSVTFGGKYGNLRLRGTNEMVQQKVQLSMLESVLLNQEMEM